MNSFFSKIESADKMRLAVAAASILFIFKILAPIRIPDAINLSFLIFMFGEALTFILFYLFCAHFSVFVGGKRNSPLSLVINVGILSAVMLFLLGAVNLINKSKEFLLSESFMASMLVSLYAFTFIGVLAYIFISFKELFFLRQTKDPQFYFTLMTVFIALASASNVFYRMNAGFIKWSFWTVSVLLISVNSLRISWIAFLTKKEKLYLLALSVALSTAFAFNLVSALDDGIAGEILLKFSPSLSEFYKIMSLYGCIHFGVIFFAALFHLPTAEAFDRKAQEASSLIHLSKMINQVFDFKELAESVVDTTILVCNCEASWLISKENGKYKLNSLKNIDYLEAEKISQMSLNSKIANETPELKIIEHDELLNVQTNDDFKSIAAAPITIHGKLNGYLFAARKSELRFDEDEKQTIKAFADNVSIAFENSKLLKESIEKERLEKELDLAREVQKKILPSKVPDIKNLQISSMFVPAFEVGGDYYDFFELEGDKFGFIIADVSGKGIPAAFIMAEVKGIFESLSKLVFSPREILLYADDVLRRALDKKNFVTAACGVIDLNDGTLYISRAGHSPIMHLSGDSINLLRPNGLGLGIDASNVFAQSLEEVRIELKEGDLLMLYTDGIPEAQNSDQEDFGYERMKKILMENKELKVDEIAEKILTEVSVFSQGSPQHDDITMVIIKWK